MLTAGFAASQIQEGYIVGDIWSKNFRPNSEDTPSNINYQSRANYIKSRLPGHLGLDGSGVIVGLHDSPYQGETHVDLKGRHRIATFGTAGGPTNNHGNFVAGTMGGNGNRNPRFEGIATRAMVYSFISGTVNIRNRLLWMEKPPDIFSHSIDETRFSYGQYDATSVTADSLLLQYPDKLILNSAGNTGGSVGGYPGGYGLVVGATAAAKNVLTVGRLAGPGATYAESRTSLANPSYGPAGDGRIKPDVIATDFVVAPLEYHTYGNSSGSSFSTPLVAGVAALLHQHFRNLNDGRNPDGVLIKAILMNSADYIDSQGPTFAGGYGGVNARRAAEIITGNQFASGQIDSGRTETISIEVPQQIDGKSIAQAKIMLYWHDVPGTAGASPALVNNLDLLVRKNGTDFLPWVLDPSIENVQQPATRGIDDINNVEQAAIDNPVAGTYEIVVSGKDIKVGPQSYFVVYSFVLDELELTFPIGDEKFFSGQTRWMIYDSAELPRDDVLPTAEYSVDGGSSWLPVVNSHGDDKVPDYFFAWAIPQMPMSSALLRISRNGRESVSAPFTISESLSLVVEERGTDAGRVHFTWNPVDDADTYEVLELIGNDDWQVYRSTTDTTLAVSKSEFTNRECWFSVRAINTQKNLYSQRAEAQLYFPFNSPPVASDDYVPLITAVNNTPPIEVPSFGPLENDTDANGDLLQLVELTHSSNAFQWLGREELETWMLEHGGPDFRIDDGGKRILYRPDRELSHSGYDTLHYKVSDYRGGVSEATVFFALRPNTAGDWSVEAPPFEIVDGRQHFLGFRPWVATVDLGFVTPGQPIPVHLNVENPTERDLLLHSPESSSLSLLESDSLRVPSGGAGQLQIVLAALDRGSRIDGTVIIQSDDPYRPHWQVDLTGGVGEAPKVERLFEDIVEVTAGDTISIALEVKNTGGSDLLLYSPLSLRGSFLIQASDTLAIGPGETGQFRVVMSPLVTGSSVLDQIRIRTNDPTVPLIKLDVRMIDENAPRIPEDLLSRAGLVNLFTVIVGDSLSFDLDVRNIGGSDLVMQPARSFLLTSEADSLIILASDTLIVAPGETGRYRVVLEPPAADGDFLGFLKIGTNTIEKQLVVQVSGTAVVFDPSNTAPVAHDDFSIILRSDQTESGWETLFIPVFVNDADADEDSLLIVQVSPSGLAIVSFFNHPNPEFSGIRYTPNSAFTGTDTLTYKIQDGRGGVSEATIIIADHVEGNTPPVANDDYGLVPRYAWGLGEAWIPVLENDTDADGDSLRMVGHSTTDLANVWFTALHGVPGFSYAPNDLFGGRDTLRYTVADGRGGAAVGTIYIIAADSSNSDPVANDDFTSLTDGATSISVPALENDTDADGDTLKIIEISPTTLATVEIQDATITYTPNTLFAGTDTLTYRIYDGRSGFATATIYISNSPGIVGDFDNNRLVNFSDFFLFAQAFGSTDPQFDLDKSGNVDLGDFFIFAQAFGS